MGGAVTSAGRGLAILGLLIAALALQADAGRAEASPAPDFSIRLDDGTNFTLSEHAGKVIVLDFMYINCNSCNINLPGLKEVYARYARGDTAARFEIVSIDIKPVYLDTPEMMAVHRETRGITWPLGWDNIGEPKLQTLYGVAEVSRTFVIDLNGFIVYDHTGANAFDRCQYPRELDAAVAAAFGGTASPITVGSATAFALIAVAAAASFFSPCSFPLLPGYMTHYLQLQAKRGGGTRAQAALGGVVTGLGITVTYAIVGVLVLFAGTAANAFIPALQPIIGVVLIALGILTLTSKQFYFLSTAVEKVRARLFGDKEESDRYYLSLFSYGAGYGAAGFGCVAAPFIAAVLYATLQGGAVMGLLAFLVFALIVIVLSIAITVALFVVGAAAVKKLNAYTEAIKKISAVALILAGVYLLSFFLMSQVTTTSCLAG
jgi:cytochrome c-type biogenesis protein